MTASPSATPHPWDLHGRAALVTGGAQGLGRGIADALAGAGVHVVVTARRRERVEEAAEQIRAAGGAATPLPWDLSMPAEAPALVDAAASAAGVEAVDTLVHAAGIQVRKPVDSLTLEEFDEVHTVHLRSAFTLSQTVGARLRERGLPGSVVLMGSLTSHLGIPHTAAYGSAKSGVLGLARSLAVEWAAHDIRCNVIVPGYFHTELTDGLFQDPDRRDWVESRIPMGRLGRADDLGGLALLLASDAGSYITGQAIAVDGGWLAA
ncbi:SDR family oxidoreductase [Egibacter rhizosphaerae]|uniref:SDR family oxidoreductase n=1 Tax=Egibacter rhizosphaerae TaxID=1670831 RepID=A0A411YBL5_9ACTN|nr:SDR family oxidoreductase [Egibacter rhizosphaerae]QBI18562.1 SDR family oxidoreductase [Egibacter rhizosphaerae]